MAGLATDTAGNLYGETSMGGAKCFVNDTKQRQGCGTVFKITKDGAYHVLVTFQGQSNGANANVEVVGYNGVTLHGKVLYGTASEGGDAGDGLVFSVNTDGSNFTILHSFSGMDGKFPIRAPAVAHDGTLYGVTQESASYDQGLLYRILPDGTFGILYNGIKNPTEFILTPGNIYGGASSGCGIVYRFDLSKQSYKTLYDFSTNPNGACAPHLGFIDNQGDLIGTTQQGAQNGAPAHFGTLFEIQKSGASYVDNILWTFSGGIDGGFPAAAPLLMADGTIVGSTKQLATNHQGGTIFGYARGSLTTLHQFARPDGLFPIGGLIEVTGTLYGTTFSGAIDCYATNQGCGSVYGYGPAP